MVPLQECHYSAPINLDLLNITRLLGARSHDCSRDNYHSFVEYSPTMCSKGVPLPSEKLQADAVRHLQSATFVGKSESERLLDAKLHLDSRLESV